MQPHTLLHWEDHGVMVCRGELVWTLLPILALARPCGCSVNGISLGEGFAARPAWELSSLPLLLLLLPELTQTGPSRSTDGSPVVLMAPLVGKGHICLISKMAQESGMEPW